MGVRIPFSRRTAIGGLVAAASLATIVAFSAGRSGAQSAGARAEGVSDARSGSLTVDLPQPVTSRIYATPRAAGRPIIVIDAGHGGRDPGASSASGEIQEKALTLVLAQQLRDVLVERGRVRVAMTRNDDRYLPLEDRSAVARSLGAALFVSLHTDSAPNPLARGASVYSLSDVASDAEAARFASHENGRAAIAGDSSSGIPAILADLAMRSEMNASADFASRLVKKAAGRFDVRPEPHRFAAFHVLRRADTPAVLFEAGYISNVDDEALLRSPEHRKDIVLALAQAIEADIAARLRR